MKKRIDLDTEKLITYIVVKRTLESIYEHDSIH